MPPIIQGNLNFGGVPSMTNVQANYEQSYANALSLNQQNYANILSGYQQLMSGQVSAQQAIAQGYQGLSGQVMQDISGIDAAQRQAINDVYAAQSGKEAQGLIARGLGNTTVANSVQRGLLAEKNKADIALSNQMAQLTAGYRSQLGLAGLNQANQSNMQNTALGSRQLDWMNSINAPYPNAAEYYKLLAMQAQMRRGAFGGLGAGSVPMQAQRQQGLVGIRPQSQGGAMPGGQAGGGFGGYQPRNQQSPVGGLIAAGAGIAGEPYAGLIGGGADLAGDYRQVPDYARAENYQGSDLTGAIGGAAGTFGPEDYVPPVQTAGGPDYSNEGANWDYYTGAPLDTGGGTGGGAWWQNMGLTGNEAANYGDLAGATAGFGGDLGQNFNDYYNASANDYNNFDYSNAGADFEY